MTGLQFLLTSKRRSEKITRRSFRKVEGKNFTPATNNSGTTFPKWLFARYVANKESVPEIFRISSAFPYCKLLD
jgi:hypothetical protein